MKDLQIANKISRAFGKTGLVLKKHSPEILVTTGIIGVVASTVLACRATIKAKDILDKTKQDVNTLSNWQDHVDKLPADYTEKDSKKDISIVKAKAGVQLAKTYAPAAALGVLSITCILAGSNILHKRNVALAAAYTTVDNSFKNYRKNVVDRFGEELDKELRYNIKAKEVEETVVDEKGKEKKVTKTVNTATDMPSGYAFFFDTGCAGWQKDAEHNKWYVLQQQNYANEKLKANGYLFLNDIYDMFGIPRTKAGQIVGWIYNKKGSEGDSFVDFGVFDLHNEAKRDFVNGYERTILIDPNVEGPILDLL